MANGGLFKAEIKHNRKTKTQQARNSMNAEFLNPKTAFNGVEGWLTINALDMIDPMPKKGTERRFKIKQEAVTTDGTIFVYVTQA